MNDDGRNRAYYEDAAGCYRRALSNILELIGEDGGRELPLTAQIREIAEQALDEI